jgi:hypothetical protein
VRPQGIHHDRRRHVRILSCADYVLSYEQRALSAVFRQVVIIPAYNYIRNIITYANMLSGE